MNHRNLFRILALPLGLVEEITVFDHHVGEVLDNALNDQTCLVAQVATGFTD